MTNEAIEAAISLFEDIISEYDHEGDVTIGHPSKAQKDAGGENAWIQDARKSVIALRQNAGTVDVEAISARIKTLMEQLGYPESISHYMAFMQLANEFSPFQLLTF